MGYGLQMSRFQSPRANLDWILRLDQLMHEGFFEGFATCLPNPI